MNLDEGRKKQTKYGTDNKEIGKGNYVGAGEKRKTRACVYTVLLSGAWGPSSVGVHVLFP